MKFVDKNLQVDIIYLDFAKAFDTVPHDLLIHKLRTFGINGSLLSLLENYLHDRYQKVVINNVSSSWSRVTSGVPQGSVLGPVLFLLYINNIVNTVNGNVCIGLFADDTKIWSPIFNQTDQVNLQNTLSSLEHWSTLWGMNFNVSKCKYMSFKNKLPCTYKLHGISLERSSYFCDLGVTVCDNLKWSQHLNTVITKAMKMLGVIKRYLGCNIPIKAKCTAYIAIVRSILFYAIEIWSPTSKSDMARLEKVQRIATRYICNVSIRDGIPYKERLRVCSLKPLNLLCEVKLIIFIYKLVHGIFNVNTTSFVNRAICIRETRQLHDGLKLSIPCFRTECYRNWMFVRGCYTWNNLPIEIRNQLPLVNPNVSPELLFKRKLYSHVDLLFDATFLCNNICTWRTWCPCHNCR